MFAKERMGGEFFQKNGIVRRTEDEEKINGEWKMGIGKRGSQSGM